MSVAAQHWNCDIEHPPERGRRTDRMHRIGCAVAEGHNSHVLPFKCRACVRGYRPPESPRRLLDHSAHFACSLEREDHEPPVKKYSKSGHRDDCPTQPGHSGQQASSCVGCRMAYMGREGELPVGRLNDHPHWHCDLPPEAHTPKPMYGIGHRPGCQVSDGHTLGKTLKRCQACRRVAQQGNVKSARLKKLYGLTRAEYDAMAERQGGVCAICGTMPDASDTTRTARGLHVDHDHETGRIRALLCYRCNIGLGYFQDRLDLLAKAREYLRDYTEA